MNKGYWIGQIDITEPNAYGAYAKEAKKAVSQFGGKYLVRGGAHETPEGNWRARHVMIEFESYQIARECYVSEAYQKAKALRAGAADTGLLIIEGCNEE